ncbi:MAG: hypothetical protein ABW115_04005 [Candidatus Thiodiazotropha sp. 6PLUC6]
MNINDAVRTAHRILRTFRTKGSNQILLRRQIKRGARGYARGLVPADGQGLIRFAHPVGAPTLRCGVLRRFTPGDSPSAHPYGAPALRCGVCVTAFLSNEGFESCPASPPNKKGCSNEHPFLFGGEAVR